jgi:transcriptional regulator with XRE-family HTH domain
MPTSATRKTKRALPCGRRLPRLRDAVPVALMQRALAWVLWQLRLRHGWSVPQMAARCGLGPQTVRDFEQARHKHCFWSTLGRLCHALNRHPDTVAALTRRWLRKHCRRELSRQRREPHRKLSLPWQHQACQNRHGMPGF